MKARLAQIDREWWHRPSLSQSAVCAAGQSSRAPVTAESHVPFWALMGFTCVLMLGPQQFFPFLGSIRIALLTAALSAGTHFYQRFVRRQPLLALSREIILAICLAGWALLCVPLSYWPGGSLNLLLDQFFKALAIFVLLPHIVTSSRQLRVVCWGLAVMSVPLSLTAVDNYLSGEFMETAGHPQAKRILGYEAPLTANPNDLALILNLTLPLCVALFFVARRPLVRSALLGILLLNATAVILTFSRAGFLTLAMIGWLYLWKLRGRPERGWVWVGLIAALLCTPLLPSGYLDRLSTIMDMKADVTGSAQERWRDLISATQYVLDHPIVGAGIGMNILALNEQRGPYWRAVHNVYLMYAIDLGLPGLLLFLLFLTNCLKNTRTVQRGCRDASTFTHLRYLAEGLEVSLLAFSFSGFFYPSGYNFSFFYMAGLAVAVKVIYEKEVRELIHVAKEN